MSVIEKQPEIFFLHIYCIKAFVEENLNLKHSFYLDSESCGFLAMISIKTEEILTSSGFLS